MIGVTGYSVYIPRYRVPREMIAAAWGKTPAPGSKAVCNFDEDALTMAQAAAWPLIAAGTQPDRLYFASTTSPFWQRSCSSQVAAGCDLPPGTATADLGGSLRASTSAILAALDSIQAGTCNSALVIASDKRDGAPESAEEMAFSDAAVAVTLGSENVITEIVATYSRSDDFLDEWRRDRDPYVQSQTSKYSLARGYRENVDAACRAVFERAGLDSTDVKSPPPTDKPLLALAQALATGKPGDLVLCAGYGEGADALLLRVLRTGPPIPTGSTAIEYASYALWRKSREYLRESSGGPEISNVLWKREERQNVRLHGTKCRVCGTVQFPIARVCGACRSADQCCEIPLARTGRVFTYTKDYLYDAPVQPTVMAVIDLDGGARFLCQMTDVNERDVRIGMPVELVLRRMREGVQVHHYYWKCRPV